MVDAKCPICGKTMCRISFVNYTYKRGNNIYCSYTCYRKDEDNYDKYGNKITRKYNKS